MCIAIPRVNGAPGVPAETISLGRGASALRRHAGHVDELPVVAVQVLEAMAVHEAVVLSLARDVAAGGPGLGDQGVDLLAALAAQADPARRRGLGIRKGLGGEGP